MKTYQETEPLLIKHSFLTSKENNDFCDLLGTPYAPVSKIAPVKKTTLAVIPVLVLFAKKSPADF